MSNGKKGIGALNKIIIFIAVAVNVVFGIKEILGIFSSDDDIKTGNFYTDDFYTDDFYTDDITSDSTDNSQDNNENNNQNTNQNNNQNNGVSDDSGLVPKYRERYDQLNVRQKEYYQQILSGVRKNKLEYYFEGASLEDISSVYQDVFLSMHPEFFWLDNSFRYRIDANGIAVSLDTYNYWKYVSNPQQYVDRLDAQVEKIVNQANKQPTTYDKVKYVHDYLVKNIEYDQDALKELDSTFMSTSTEQTLSIYGALVNGKTLCGGYSESFYYLMKKLGIECYYITGYAGEYHAWNYLKLDGDYYYMDVTWDDTPVTNRNGISIYPDNVMYDYFCITSNEISKNHTVDSFIDVPYADSVAYSYFVREGLVFDTYNYNEAKNALSKQKNNSAMFLKYTNKSAFDAAYDELITDGKIWRMNVINKKVFYHRFDNDIYTIMIIPSDYS